MALTFVTLIGFAYFVGQKENEQSEHDFGQPDGASCMSTIMLTAHICTFSFLKLHSHLLCIEMEQSQLSNTEL